MLIVCEAKVPDDKSEFRWIRFLKEQDNLRGEVTVGDLLPTIPPPRLGLEAILEKCFQGRERKRPGCLAFIKCTYHTLSDSGARKAPVVERSHEAMHT